MLSFSNNRTTYYVATRSTSQSTCAMKRRRSIAQASAATALGFAAVAMLSNDGASVSSSSSLLRRVLSTNSTVTVCNSTHTRSTEIPRRLTKDMFAATIHPGTNPDLDGFQCEVEYRHDPTTGEGAWTRPEKSPQVPPGSPFEINNNFRTQVSTSNLNVLFVGDSVGENMARFWETAHNWGSELKGTDQEVIEKNSMAPRRPDQEEIVKDNFYNLPGYKQAVLWANRLPEESGGGSIGFVRVLKLWKDRNRGFTFKSWEPRIFKKYSEAHGNTDVLVYRSPWPWLANEPVNTRSIGNGRDEVGKIAASDYAEILEMAHKYLRPHTVILVTTPVNNNALRDGMVSLRKDNEVIRTFVKEYKPPVRPEDGVQNVLLLDWELLVDDMIRANAEVLGIPPEKAFSHYITGENSEKLAANKKKGIYPQLTAMSCSGTSSLGGTVGSEFENECPEAKMGRISPDGMHFCGTTLGPRTNGGLACLIRCTIDANDDVNGGSGSQSSLKACQDMCNNLFMNMETVIIGGTGTGTGIDVRQQCSNVPL